ncbi:hypothetical protein Poli38472_004511 [Pythium oligandrum]|uniref:Uncharacterized protein n=1 Tax=Pythium oligandrum TaxID=41045 RepID=A0A8K1CBR2_PYTOL|nr:hypothetical protein Poli38472_004511 [Pythium oligandrum]|eukprot:TMW59442.1 hypothetical protein Poli38472_004511 [Pythium oligandrum]
MASTLAFNAPFLASAASPASPRLADASTSLHGVMLAWEDVLAPITLLGCRVGLTNSNQALQNAQLQLAQDVYLQQALAGIEEQMLQLITTAATLGPVYIVTSKSLKFMELSCSLFFPRLAAFLLQANMTSSVGLLAKLQQHRVQVIAAPRKFTTAVEEATWRLTVFQQICVDVAVQRALMLGAPLPTTQSQSQLLLRDFEVGRFGLISLSALEVDTPICVKALEATAPFAVPKCVQVSSEMSLEAFFAQLQTLKRYVGSAAAQTNAFATRL